MNLPKDRFQSILDMIRKEREELKEIRRLTRLRAQKAAAWLEEREELRAGGAA